MEKEGERFDVLVIGAGLSSLTAAALLAKRGLRVLCVEQHAQPGGSCGAFRLQGRTIDQGTSMFFGFGPEGFNPHHYVMNVLEEPIDVIKHTSMYRLVYGGRPIDFHADVERYLGSLGQLFGQAVEGIRRFYAYIADLYFHVIAADRTYMAPTELARSEALFRFFRHPVRNLKLFPLLSKSAGELLRRFVDSEDVVKFFSKLTSTYCYTTLDETPAILAITMFMENHVGGSYYVVGGSHQLPGKLERSLERHGGTIRYRTKAVQLLFDNGLPSGALLEDASGSYKVASDRILYGGTLLNLHAHLIPQLYRDEAQIERTKVLKMSFPSVVLHCVVDKEALPEGTLPIEMLADNIDSLDEKEVTMYAFSLSDPSICAEDEHVVMAIGPSLRSWPRPGEGREHEYSYMQAKEEETNRLLGILESHFPGFRERVRTARLATPTTIERFTMKEHGHVAGPKQSIGQDLLNRQRARGGWSTLYHCGEATVMGTGSLAVTISGISAANLILRDLKLEEYRMGEAAKDMVTVLDARINRVRRMEDGRRLPSLNAIATDDAVDSHDKASACQWCLDAPCNAVCPASYDIPSLMRRLECGNLEGAVRQLHLVDAGEAIACASCPAPCKDVCRAMAVHGAPVAIDSVLLGLVKEPRDTP